MGLVWVGGCDGYLKGWVGVCEGYLKGVQGDGLVGVRVI
jgi:hypothetical protein